MKRIIMTVAFVSLFVGLAAAESGNSATGAIANAQYVNTNSLVVKDMTGTKLAHVINTNNRTMQARIANAFKKAKIKRVKVAVINGEVFLRGTATKKEEAKVMQIVNAANPNQISNMISVIK